MGLAITSPSLLDSDDVEESLAESTSNDFLLNFDSLGGMLLSSEVAALWGVH